jgi:molecular chaperone HtpG
LSNLFSTTIYLVDHRFRETSKTSAAQYVSITDNFLTSKTIDQVEREVTNIQKSYSHYWDILAELCQNSVDAVRDWEEECSASRNHKIELSIDRQSKTVEISDTGIGIDPNRMPELLAPMASAKDTNQDTIGEKGVGLTFWLFCSNTFNLETKSTEGTYSTQIKGARTWYEKNERDNIPSLSKRKEVKK